MDAANHPQVYEIQVQDQLDQEWQQWFDGLAVTLTNAGGPQLTTTLVGTVADQAALRGMLCKLWDLNLALVSVRRVMMDREEEHDDG
jgi:hypothetical protein